MLISCMISHLSQFLALIVDDVKVKGGRQFDAFVQRNADLKKAIIFFLSRKEDKDNLIRSWRQIKVLVRSLHGPLEIAHSAEDQRMSRSH